MDITSFNNIPTYFIDGIGEIRFLNGVVRISYGSFYTKNNEQQEQPEFKNEFKLVMPITSFIGILKAQQDLYNQLVERNVIPNETTNNTILQPNQNI